MTATVNIQTTASVGRRTTRGVYAQARSGSHHQRERRTWTLELTLDLGPWTLDFGSWAAKPLGVVKLASFDEESAGSRSGREPAASRIASRGEVAASEPMPFASGQAVVSALAGHYSQGAGGRSARNAARRPAETTAEPECAATAAAHTPRRPSPAD